MQDAFVSAVYADKWRVMGQRVGSLSAAHLLLMHALKLGCVTGQACTVQDILVAAKICAAKVRLLHGVYRPDVNLRPTLRDHWHLARCSVNKKKLQAEVEAWNGYLAEQLAIPEKYDTPGKQPKSVTSPGILATVVRMMPKVGEERAWRMPYGHLRILDEISAELEGADIRFQPAEEELAKIEEELDAADRAGAELMARMKKEKEGANGKG